MNAKRNHSIRGALLGAIAIAGPAFAAEVTPERLVNADKEPQNWLMNHRTYDGQRFSPLDADQPGQRQEPEARLRDPARRQQRQRIQRGNAACRGRLPLHHRLVGRGLQDRRHLGEPARIVWRMDPKQEQPRQNRGAALWGNLVITAAI